jgi:hypothetical protein
MSDEKPVRPRGRPKQAAEPLTSIVSTCLTPSEHDAMIRLANNSRASSLSEYGRRVFVLHLRQSGHLPTEK